MYQPEEETSLRWLSRILDILRKDCPWDRVQTEETLRYLTIEETYELSEAILANNKEEECKELGDLFMHLLFYAKIADEQGHFTTQDVIDSICRKLISRHPHIPLPDKNGVLQQPQQSTQPRWEIVKMKEGRKSVMEGVPSSLPSLVKAVRIQEKASGMGFDFDTAEEAFAKVREEYDELQAVLSHPDANEREQHQQSEEEFGDLLFALIKWGHMLGINADDALAHTNNKFAQRFAHIEQSAQASGHALSELNKAEMLTLWNQAKELQQSKTT